MYAAGGTHLESLDHVSKGCKRNYGHGLVKDVNGGFIAPATTNIATIITEHYSLLHIDTA